MQVQIDQADEQWHLLPVRTPEDIEFLVKESEVVTGHAGRTFVIAGADRLTYRVHWCPREHPLGLTIERLDTTNQILCAERLQLWEFIEHPLMDALATGQLYTLPVRRRP